MFDSAAPVKTVDPGQIEGVSADSAASVDVEGLGRQLMGTWADIRAAAREFAGNPQLHRIDGLTLDGAPRAHVRQLELLVEHGAVQRAFPKAFGGEDDNGGNIAAFEELVLADPRLQIKSGVQWGLFGSAVLHLGTEYHHEKFLPGIMTLEGPRRVRDDRDRPRLGCRGDRHDRHLRRRRREEFVIHTPFRGAWKDYLGNAALHGIAAVVFAQLITKGVNHGVHAFYVPLRDDERRVPARASAARTTASRAASTASTTAGCTSTTCASRARTCSTATATSPTTAPTRSPIASPGRRFFTMLGTLVQGRVSLDGAATVGIAPSALDDRDHLRATSAASSTPASDTDEEVLLDYQRHQRRLLPLLATTYAQIFAHDELLAKFDAVFSRQGRHRRRPRRTSRRSPPRSSRCPPGTRSTRCRRRARRAAAPASSPRTGSSGCAPTSTSTSPSRATTTCCCSSSRKRLLTDYATQFTKADAGALARYVVVQAADRAYHGTGLRSLAQTVADFGSTARSVARAARRPSAARAAHRPRARR